MTISPKIASLPSTTVSLPALSVLVSKLGCLLITSEMGIKFSLFIVSDGSAFLMFIPSTGRGLGALYEAGGVVEVEGADEAGVDSGVSQGGL